MRNIFFSCVTTLLLASSLPTMASCPPSGATVAELQTLKAQQWQIDDAQRRQLTALALADCLASPDPQLRDEIAFEALSFWMRKDLLLTPTLDSLREAQLQNFREPKSNDAAGFARPFAALILAEIVRVDRLHPYLRPEQREELVNVAAEYLSTLRDFRGFDEHDGWRHGIAHGADWMLQLSLNPALQKVQHQRMLSALAVAIKNDQHFYHYGESDRLMAPVFYLGIKADLSSEEWSDWFDQLLTSTRNLQQTSQASLARKHNLTMFLHSLYVNLQETRVNAVKEKLLPSVIKSLKKLN